MDNIVGMLELESNINDISIQEKIGSMLVIGFPGYDICDESNIDYLKGIENRNIGSVILYGRNIKSEEQLKKLTNNIHEVNKDCMIFVDQEGGKVQRLKFNLYPNAEFISNNYSEKEAYDIYYNMAAELKDCGIDANFGPIVDLNNKVALCPVIGGLKRSYSDNPDIVVKYASCFIDAHRDNNILTSIKHFPGHGYANGDTHHGLVDVTDSYNELELIPFYKLIELNKVDMIMTAHIINKNYDLIYPATLSKVTIDKLLREKNYDGVIVSDDLHMGAIIENYDFEESVLESISAGCDMLILSNNPLSCKNKVDFSPDSKIAERTIELVILAIESGRINIEQINKSYNRIKLLRKNYFKQN